MANFSINFEYPLLLLLLIPAVFFTLFMFFRLQKRYRRNRNRISSIILHLIVMVLSISVLAGITISYDKVNEENELIILVDVSDSNKESQQKKDLFVRSVLDEGADVFKMGVVTFGFDQVFTNSNKKLSTDADKVYQDYVNAELPNTTATDIASALNYARTLLETPETAKIVVVSDGIETDGNAISTVKSIAADGIAVDTVYYPTVFDDDVQLIGVTLPGYNVLPGASFNLTLSLQSSIVGSGTITLTDVDEDGGISESTTPVDFIDSVNEIVLTHSLSSPGLHKLCFTLTSVTDDNLSENNIFYTYMYLEEFDEILMIERYEDEGLKLKEILEDEENGGFKVTKVNAINSETMPNTLDKLRQYEQVILYNVSNEDLETLDFDFVGILKQYVEEIGGGLFTVGGNQQDDAGNVILDNNRNPISNAYNRDDMRGTILQDILPVQAEDYSPPAAVMFVLDCSSSMEEVDDSTGEQKFIVAKKGIKSCVDNPDGFSARDYAGVMTFDDEEVEQIQLTPLTQKTKILDAVDEIEIGGGTIFTGAIQSAGLVLASANVERRHMVLLTDALPGDPYESYSPAVIENYEKHGITFSMFVVGSVNNPQMQELCQQTGGDYYSVAGADLPSIMNRDLGITAITAYNPEPFEPKLDATSPVTAGVKEEDVPELGGFYGAKLKEGAVAPIMAPYVPVYAQWNYGKGKVGSFMCDLNGVWSTEFIRSSAGLRLLSNIVVGLFPIEDIKSKDIDLDFKQDNYTTRMSIYTSMEKNNTIGIVVTSPPDAESEIETIQVINPSAKDDYSRINFQTMQAGVHQILVEKKLDQNGDVSVLSKVIEYRAFSYSKEYDVFVDPSLAIDFIEKLATNGRGTVVASDEPWDIFDDFEKYIHIVIDPRLALIIIALICFLLDIAVRKFKFKWPHEIIRDYRVKKELSGKGKK